MKTTLKHKDIVKIVISEYDQTLYHIENLSTIMSYIDETIKKKLMKVKSLTSISREEMWSSTQRGFKTQKFHLYKT